MTMCFCISVKETSSGWGARNCPTLNQDASDSESRKVWLHSSLNRCYFIRWGNSTFFREDETRMKQLIVSVFQDSCAAGRFLNSRLWFFSKGHGLRSRRSFRGAAGAQTSVCHSPSAPCSTSWWMPRPSQPSCVPWTWDRRWETNDSNIYFILNQILWLHCKSALDVNEMN